MIEKDVRQRLSDATHDTQLRLQRNTSKRVMLLDGVLAQNTASTRSGVSARVCVGGAFGFAAAPSFDDDAIRSVLRTAEENAVFLNKKQPADGALAPVEGHEQALLQTKDNAAVPQKRIIERCTEIDAYIREKYPSLLSRAVIAPCLDMEKLLITTDGAYAHQITPHASLYLSMTAEDADGNPTELIQNLGDFGTFDDVFDDSEALRREADALYEQLMQKCGGVHAQAGVYDCILHPDLAGMLAHEAVGHTTEADFVLSGSVAGPNLNKQVASELVTMVDFAHTAFGKRCPIPVYTDDEGVSARDVTIIQNGVLRGYMHDRESAQHFGVAPTGNARAFEFSDEPLIRMRNTVILPGTSKLEQMIASVDDGYYFIKTGNGQADSTGEFMFGVEMGYEIKHGRLGRPLRSTTISGVAFEMLKTVTMLSDTISWVSTGMCGKKQPIPVGMAGPAIRCRVNVGGR